MNRKAKWQQPFTTHTHIYSIQYEVYICEKEQSQRTINSSIWICNNERTHYFAKYILYICVCILCITLESSRSNLWEFEIQFSNHIKWVEYLHKSKLNYLYIHCYDCDSTFIWICNWKFKIIRFKVADVSFFFMSEWSEISLQHHFF